MIKRMLKTTRSAFLKLVEVGILSTVSDSVDFSFARLVTHFFLISSSFIGNIYYFMNNMLFINIIHFDILVARQFFLMFHTVAWPAT